MSKLTLSVDPRVVSRAKRYAKARGLSVSGMVESYLSAVAQPSAAIDDPPLLRAVKGTLKRANLEEYHKHLVDKYH